MQDYRSLGEILLDLTRCETAQAAGQRAKATGLWAKLHLDDDAGRIEALCKARYGAFNSKNADALCAEVCVQHDSSDYEVKRLPPSEFIELAKELRAIVPSAFQPASDFPMPKKRKHRGRRKADYETLQQEAKLAAKWARARDAGVYKADFAKQIKMTLKQLDALLDRVAKRNRPSE